MSNNATPSDDWSVIRGTATGSIVSPSLSADAEGGVDSYGFLGQAEVPYLLAGRAAEGTLTFKSSDFPALSQAASYTYLYVYLSPEDLAGSWQWYNEKDQRSYYIEGSAMLVPVDSAFTFATAAEPPTTTREYELVRNGVVPSFDATETLSPVLQVTVQKNGDPIDYNSIKQLAATVVGNGGHVNGTKLDYPNSASTKQYAIIYGYGFKGTWPDLPGLVVYDVINAQMLYTDVAIGIDAAMSQLLKDGVYGVLDVIYNYGTLCPLLYQIGHTNPTPVLDGTLCYRDVDSVGYGFIHCAYFSVSDGNITTSVGAVSLYDTAMPLAQIYSTVGRYNASTHTSIGMNAWAFPHNGYIYVTSREPDYPWNNIPVPYVGTIKGMVPISFSTDDTSITWNVFVYGDLTSVGGESCSHCAIVSMKAPSGESSAENPYTYVITVPDIDSDTNWPTLGDNWSV